MKGKKLNVLGCNVGVLTVTRPSFNTCSNVVFPALSNPKNRIFAFL